MKVTIEIEMNNAAFHDTIAGAEVARILRDTAAKIEGAAFINDYDRSLTLRDINGNPVGKFNVRDTRGL